MTTTREIPSQVLSQSFTATAGHVNVVNVSGCGDGVEEDGDLLDDLGVGNEDDSDEEDAGFQESGSPFEEDEEQQQQNTKTTEITPNKRQRGNYKCRRCGQPKRGHVCPYEEDHMFPGLGPVVHQVSTGAIDAAAKDSVVAASSVRPRLQTLDMVNRQILHLGKIPPGCGAAAPAGLACDGVVLTPLHRHDEGMLLASGPPSTRLHMRWPRPFSRFRSHCAASSQTSVSPRNAGSCRLYKSVDKSAVEDNVEFDASKNLSEEDEYDDPAHVTPWQSNAFAGGHCHQKHRMNGSLFVGQEGASLSSMRRIHNNGRDDKILLGGEGTRDQKRKMWEPTDEEDYDDGIDWSGEGTVVQSCPNQPWIIAGVGRGCAKKKLAVRRHQASVVSAPSDEADGLMDPVSEAVETPYGSPLSMRGDLPGLSMEKSSHSGSEPPTSSRSGFALGSISGSVCTSSERPSQDVCMLHILSKLAPLDLLAASACCRRWHRLAREIWLNVEEVSFVLGETQTPLQYVQFILQKCPQLVRVTLNVRMPVSDALLLKISEERPSLKSLVIRVAPGVDCQVTGAGISTFVSSCQSLEKLQVERCSLVTSFTANSNSLRSLLLSSCSQLGSVLLECPLLEELSLKLLTPDTSRSAKLPLSASPLSPSDREGEETKVSSVLSKICCCRQSLVSLHVSSKGLTDAAVKALFSAAWSRLQALSLTFAAFITDDSIKGIVENCRHLTSVDFSGCSTLTDMALCHLSSGFSLSLKRVQLALCPRLSMSAIEKLLLGLPNLQILDCNRSLVAFSPPPRVSQSSSSSGIAAPMRDDGSQDRQESVAENENPIENQPRLGEGCNRVGSQGIESRVLRLQHWKILQVNLQGCTVIEGIEVDCPELEDLNINNCYNLSPVRIFLHCPRLQRLHVARCLPDVIRHLRQQQDFLRRRLDAR